MNFFNTRAFQLTMLAVSTIMSASPLMAAEISYITPKSVYVASRAWAKYVNSTSNSYANYRILNSYNNSYAQSTSTAYVGGPNWWNDAMGITSTSELIFVDPTRGALNLELTSQNYRPGASDTYSTVIGNTNTNRIDNFTYQFVSLGTGNITVDFYQNTFPKRGTFFVNLNGNVSIYGPSSGYTSIVTEPLRAGALNYIQIGNLNSFTYTGLGYVTNFETRFNWKINFDRNAPLPAFADADAIPSISNVPEPASWAMMIAGFGLVGARMRKRCPVAA